MYALPVSNIQSIISLTGLIIEDFKPHGPQAVPSIGVPTAVPSHKHTSSRHITLTF